jgi:hypothetical protein
MGWQGVRKIAVFNLPWYAAAVAMNLAGIVWLAGAYPSGLKPWALGALSPWARGALGPWAFCAMAAADFWLLSSLAVSHYVYDRSPLARGAWLEGLDAGKALRVAVLHAGQDEASAAVTGRLPKASVRILDFHDPRRGGTVSLRRARELAGPSRAEPADAGSLPLADEGTDLAVLAFAAHELRRPGDRAALFRELRRTVGAQGRIRMVEHLRDGWNLLAYGPGAFHFLTRAAWERSFAEGGLRVAKEWPCTPFVRVFDLEAMT